MMKTKLLCKQMLFLFMMAGVPCNVVNAFSFTQGHYYATNDSSTITEYDSSGAVVGNLSLAMDPYYEGLRGLAFGPDNLLYVTYDKWIGGFEVLGLNSSGEIEKTYTASVRLGANQGFGNIEFDNNGFFYVANSTGIVKFDVDIPVSQGYFTNIEGTYDIETMPNGNFLILSKYYVQETDSYGNILNTITNPGFDHNRAIEYDHFNDTVYMSTSGQFDFIDRLCKLDIATGEIFSDVYFHGIMDFCISDNGNIAVGSNRQAPGFFTNNLEFIGSFESSLENYFITQYPTPEPATLLLLGLGAVMVRRKR